MFATDRPAAVPGKAVVALALLFAASGTLHFFYRDFFDAAIPAWIPYHGAVISVSGLLELLGAAGLLIPQTREVAAWALIALLVAVFPANLQMLASARAVHSPAWEQALLWMRLPLQPLLMWVIYRYAARPAER